ncbi:glycerophosphodiester phosphodiesterase [Paenibacillus hemerocallicola]|jgi:glycerophosphoryl diester phosphodiesterase|uniref:Glycerophosphodiester phosphodiesterase n=1 Tax=Paenibacillus hemerocallicola TaxID=1172614 RepID=A0A5C4T576_9BACL|nr:glycerophosphodiester phosphodiesterase [Paenibacillus hemerocallicola]TNJ63497.1 glycerophosphodiester phosphodiesterase [Paenibacillus hemerocallicola]
MKNNDQLMVIAHRGAAGEAPENTLAAFALGLEQGCTGIELDIHLSKDGEIIVCHDTTLDRTTDRKGAISEQTVEELKLADAGRWFHERFEGERVPLLEEVFDLVPPEVQINVEIKAGVDDLVPALIGLMKRKNRVENVFVSSFDFDVLERLKGLEPEAKIGLLYNIRMSKHYRMADLLDCPVYSLHPHWSRMDKQKVREATGRGLHVYPWTVNKEEGMREMIACGVSGIITDYPGRLKKLLEG